MKTSGNVIKLELKGNVIFIGPIGCGKTMSVKNMISNLNDVLIIDPHREYCSFESEYDNVRILELNPKNDFTSVIELKDDDIQLAKEYKYVVIDEVLNLEKEQLVSLLDVLSETKTIVIMTSQDAKIASELESYFSHIIYSKPK